jgi:poly(A) polymerase
MTTRIPGKRLSTRHEICYTVENLLIARPSQDDKDYPNFMVASPPNADTALDDPTILPRSAHSISRKHIDENTLKVLYRLHRHGYQAYLVGGSVRDIQLGRKPKDFDVGTDATPQQVKKLFRNCFLVGRRFRLAHIRFGRDQVIEVATFRRHPHPDELPEDPDEHSFFVQNQFGTPREDAFRRDFTINALFYNIADFSIVDHVGGLEDLERRHLRVIGKPKVRFAEDPVRMLRALEFGARLDFSLDAETLAGITEQAPLIADAAPARVREELLELFRHGVGARVLQQAQALGLMQPMMGGYETGATTFKLLESLNLYFKQSGTVDEAMLLAALFIDRFWQKCPVRAALPISEVVQSAGHLLTPYCTYFRLSHGLRHQAREILVGCYRFARGLGHRGQKRFLQNPATPRALEIFGLWTAASDGDRALVTTWQKALHTGNDPTQKPAKQPTRRTRRRPRRRRQGERA